MQIQYTGKLDDLTSQQREQIDVKYNKLAKLLDGKSEGIAHVILTTERHLHNAEITASYRDHSLVSTASDGDLFTAMTTAVEKLEKQVMKVRDKRRDSYRHDRDKSREAAADVVLDELQSGVRTPQSAAPANGAPKSQKRIYRVGVGPETKPMTVDEAILLMDDHSPYFVFQDLDTDNHSVLIRRPDGNLDLISC